MPPVTLSYETVRQLSSPTSESAFALSVLAKRTYTVADDGTCIVADRQIPLYDEVVTHPEKSNLLQHDLDLIPGKARTDVIVSGHAYSSGREPAIVASVAIGERRKEVLVVGPRRCSLSAAGRVVISAAEPFERIPVSFLRAYGGRDQAAEEKYGNPFAQLAPFLAGTAVDVDLHSPFLYPKNLCGTGFLVEASRDAVERCVLPNLEDPRDLLTPDRLVVGHPARWIYMPIPQGLGWVTWGWFPRLAWSGIWPDYEKMDRPIPEIEKGLLPPEVLADPAGDEHMPTHPHAARIANGAPLDLQFPHLRPDTSIELTHLHPRRARWVIRLPGHKPKIWTDGRNGKLNATDPVIQTVTIEPDEARVTVVWCGSAPAIRPYFPQELTTMPLLVEW
jgi:hypothetical protein